MARFSYVYKTSSGVRNVGILTAKSKEEVFEKLRQQGIKAIKVERVLTFFDKLYRGFISTGFPIIAASIVALLVVYFSNQSRAPISESGKAESELLGRFIGQTDTILQDHTTAFNKCSNDFRKAQSVIDLTRTRLRTSFREFSRLFESDSTFRQRAEMHYGKLTANLDEEELLLEELSDE